MKDIRAMVLRSDVVVTVRPREPTDDTIFSTTVDARSGMTTATLFQNILKNSGMNRNQLAALFASVGSTRQAYRWMDGVSQCRNPEMWRRILQLAQDGKITLDDDERSFVESEIEHLG